jgi:hypothetical protein
MMKINNQIHIENKKKVYIVEQLIANKFAPDPVKQWKEIQRRKELELCGEVNLSDDEDEGEEGNQTTVVLDKKVSDYDYLVGMAIWKLSMEDKDKLLAESQSKKDELETLERKQWSDLYEEDLVAFTEALDKQVRLLRFYTLRLGIENKLQSKNYFRKRRNGKTIPTRQAMYRSRRRTRWTLGCRMLIVEILCLLNVLQRKRR